MITIHSSFYSDYVSDYQFSSCRETRYWILLLLTFFMNLLVLFGFSLPEELLGARYDCIFCDIMVFMVLWYFFDEF